MHPLNCVTSKGISFANLGYDRKTGMWTDPPINTCFLNISTEMILSGKAFTKEISAKTGFFAGVRLNSMRD